MKVTRTLSILLSACPCPKLWLPRRKSWPFLEPLVTGLGLLNLSSLYVGAFGMPSQKARCSGFREHTEPPNAKYFLRKLF